MANSEVSRSSKRYTAEFKVDAVRQVTDRGFKVIEVAERLGVTTHSLYANGVVFTSYLCRLPVI
ncbi:hypothetical protein Y887_16730, partial [Xanthomonas pisi DSM 18956]|uniref:transposase n=1 Tax=Xanthomonas pisi TaxID=56457 RepID=UPI00062D68DF